MKVTNLSGLPAPLVDAVTNDPYTKGDSDFSVTELLSPPRISVLRKKHEEEIVEDASDRIWSLMGQVVHGILERADVGGVSERRLSIKVGTTIVSGQVDRYLDGLLQDYKVTTIWKFKNNQVPREFEEQLNCYAEILRQNGYPVNKLEIVGILRDFSKMEAKRYPDSPQKQVLVLNVPLWHEDKAKAFLKGRVKAHLDARNALPECTEHERWTKPTVYAVMKAGRKTAVKLHDTLQFAQNHAASEPGLSVTTRQGESIRCGNYCSVSQFCTQYQNNLKQELAS
jgi:hypothetical protein